MARRNSTVDRHIGALAPAVEQNSEQELGQDEALAIRESLRDGNIEMFEEYTRSETPVPSHQSRAYNNRTGTQPVRNMPNLQSDNPRYRSSSVGSPGRGGEPSAPETGLTDEELAFQLDAQLNRESSENFPVANTLSMAEEQDRLLRSKTFIGSYCGIIEPVKPYFTYSIILICLLMMVLEIVVNNNREGQPFEDFQKNPLFGPSLDTLLFLGAKRTDLIVEEGQFYRLILPIFLHGGLLHLLFNMLFLYSFGSGLEAEFGHTIVAYIFLTSGFFGVLSSAIFNPTIPSVGASGACYGLIGAAWADFGLNFGAYKNSAWKSWLFQLTFGTILNLALGLIPTLDNFAHIGGLLAGLFTGLSVLTLPRRDIMNQVKPDKCYQVVLKTISIFVVPLLIVVGLIVLYVQVDVDAYCPWCEYLNCVPTPWWSCGVQCEEGFEISFINVGDEAGSAVIRCPRDIGEITVPPPLPILEGDTAAQLKFCEDHCLL